MSTNGDTPDQTITAPDQLPGPIDGLVPERGDALDRYLIVDRIGDGGMGSVYRAYDPDLDRAVALKLVRADRVHRDEDAQRILREARAIAKLAHPNVVAVHDVGEHEGAVFIVMELVAGTDLAQWAAAKPRSAEEILAVYRAAGAGLSAAHEAGLLHRDVKPRNILVGDDGRVRVADFGLARVAGLAPPTIPERDLVDSPAYSDTVTVAGAVIGSPAYMAPETLTAQTGDHRSDQFSFCVSLYETLTGQRPPRDETGGADFDTSKIRGLTPRMRRALARGLSTSPALRFPSMNALLAELEPRNRRAWAAGALGVGVFAAAAALIVSAAQTPEECTGAPKEWAAAWNRPAANRVMTAFVTANDAYGRDTFERVNQLIERYGQAWRRTRTRVCRDTFVSQTASQRVFDAKQRCLEQRLVELNALTEVWLEHVDVSRAVAGALALTPIAECDDERRLLATEDLPVDAASRDAVETINAELERTKALHGAGQYKACTALATDLATRAEAVPYPRSLGHAALWLARCERLDGHAEQSIAHADRAIRAAASTGDDDTEANAWIEKRFALLEGRKSFEEAKAIHEETERAVLRANNAPDLVAKLELQAGLFEYHQGNYDQAVEHYERARQTFIELLGEADPNVAKMHNNIGNALNRGGDAQGAREHHEKALAIKRAALGPLHPSVATSLNNLGHAHRYLNQLDEALDYYQQALDLRHQVFGPDHPLIAVSLGSIGNVYDRRGDFAKAREYHQRALDIRLAVLGPTHLSTAFSLANLGYAARRQGDFAAARDFYERALSIRETAYGAGHPNTFDTLIGYAETLADLNELDAARKHFERVVGYYASIDGDKLWQRGEARFGLARVLWRQGDKRAAHAQAQRAIDELATSTGAADIHARAVAWQRGLK